MKNLMKKGAVQFVLLCLFAFSHLAQADVRSMYFNDGLTEVSYDWDPLDFDAISNFQFSIVGPELSSLVLADVAPSQLGDPISFDADGIFGEAEIDFDLADVIEDLSTGLFTHVYDLDVVFLDPQFSNFDVIGAEAVFNEVSAVPVPAALPLMASAIGLFGVARRRQA